MHRSSWPLFPATCRDLVAGGARAAGAVADVQFRVADGEHERRLASGLGAVTSLAVLDALMCLPPGMDVRAVDLGDVSRAHLRGAPPGCVEWRDRDATLRRLAVLPGEVSLVIVPATGWRSGLVRAAAFAPFAARVVRLDKLPARWPAPAWEAVSAGVGVWAPGGDGEFVEFVPPTPFVARFAKPARWRFVERAYRRWLTTSGR